MVREPGSVSEQVTDRYGALCLHEAYRRRRLVLRVGRIQNFHLLELRDEVGDWFVQEKPPLLIKHHHRDARDRFCHGADPEDVIGLHGLSVFPVGHTKGLEIGNLAVTRYQADHASDETLVNTFLDVPADPFQTFG